VACGLLLAAALPAVATRGGHRSIAAAASQSCESLESLSLPNTSIASATSVAAGAFVPGQSGRRGAAPARNPFADVPAFCRVEGTVKRSGDTDVKFEVWLPGNWNGEFQPAASGFAGGTISYGQMAAIVKGGAATVNTNRGHDGGGPWKPADLAALPYHLAVEQGKAIVSAHYGRRPAFTFMNECGNGGSRDALQEVQTAPSDLDAAVGQGIIYYATRHGVSQAWMYHATHKDEASTIPLSKLPAIHQAALDACDADDGLKDGVIGDPLHCRFDPAVLLCKNGDAPDCLTAPQVAAAKQIYSPPVHARTGQRLFGTMPPGSEMSWGPMIGPNLYPYAQAFYRNLVFKDQAWEYAKHPMNFDTDVDRGDAPENLPINANNPDLSAFLARGGKLLLVGGWNDDLAPTSFIDYYDSIVAKMGERKIHDSVMLFMVPAMGHCLDEESAFGPTTNFDAVGFIRRWKTTGKAPRQIVVTQAAKGQPAHRRLVCAYPAVARYKGAGDVEDPAHYSCQSPR
jgi:feruloyl esterase